MTVYAPPTVSSPALSPDTSSAATVGSRSAACDAAPPSSSGWRSLDRATKTALPGITEEQEPQP